MVAFVLSELEFNVKYYSLTPPETPTNCLLIKVDQGIWSPSNRR